MKFTQHSPDEEVGINLTPLIDIVFLLLIFFMVSTTFDTTSQLKIKLPKANQQEKVKSQDNKLDIVIDAKGRFFLNSREINSQKSEALMAAIDRVVTSYDQPVVIQSDAASPVQSLVTAMDVVGRLGLTRVSIATTRPIE